MRNSCRLAASSSRALPAPPSWRSLGLFVSVGLLIITSCGYGRPIPPTVVRDVDPDLTLLALSQDPEAYRGKTVALTGEVLAARHTERGTLVEVLHLPSYKWEPVLDRSASEGRFLAVKTDFLDPATLPPHTRVTIVGTVTGTSTESLTGLQDYRYPEVAIQYVKAWQELPPIGARPRVGVSIGGGTAGSGFGLGGGIGVGF